MVLLLASSLLVLGLLSTPEVTGSPRPALRRLVDRAEENAEAIGVFAMGFGALSVVYGLVRLLGLLGIVVEGGLVFFRFTALIGAVVLLIAGFILGGRSVAAAMGNTNTEVRIEAAVEVVERSRTPLGRVAVVLGLWLVIAALVW